MGAYVLFGDPNLIVPSAANPLQQTRHLTRDWYADVSRWAALRSDEALSRACAALASGDEGIDALSAGERAFVAAWLGSSAEAQSGAAYLDRDEFCDRIAGRDPLAGAALRVLLAIEAVDGVYVRAKPHFVLASPVAELVRAMRAAEATHDMIAVPALAIRLAEAAPQETADARLQAQRLLDEAEGTLSGWVSEEPDAARLLDSVRAVRVRS